MIYVDCFIEGEYVNVMIMLMRWFSPMCIHIIKVLGLKRIVFEYSIVTTSKYSNILWDIIMNIVIAVMFIIY